MVVLHADNVTKGQTPAIISLTQNAVGLVELASHTRMTALATWTVLKIRTKTLHALHACLFNPQLVAIPVSRILPPTVGLPTICGLPRHSRNKDNGCHQPLHLTFRKARRRITVPIRICPQLRRCRSRRALLRRLEISFRRSSSQIRIWNRTLSSLGGLGNVRLPPLQDGVAVRTMRQKS